MCTVRAVRVHESVPVGYQLVPVGGAGEGVGRAEGGRAPVRTVALGRAASTASAATAGDVVSRPHSCSELDRR